MCDYHTDRRNNMDKHFKTSKHIKRSEQNKQYVCEYCDKVLKSKTTLWRHKKACKEIEDKKQKENNDEKKEEMRDMLRMMFEEFQMASSVNNCNNSINNNLNNTINNTTNNHFNLNFFLNETCKNAMTIEEFISSIDITMSQLDLLAEEGYEKAMTHLLFSNLKKLDVTERPMHCTDVKRETIYINEEGKWEKDNAQKDKTNEILNRISRLHIKELTTSYKVVYPNCLTDINSKEHDNYYEIAYNAFGGPHEQEKLNGHIIHKLVKEIKVEKK